MLNEIRTKLERIHEDCEYLLNAIEEMEDLAYRRGFKDGAEMQAKNFGNGREGEY